MIEFPTGIEVRAWKRHPRELFCDPATPLAAAPLRNRASNKNFFLREMQACISLRSPHVRCLATNPDASWRIVERNFRHVQRVALIFRTMSGDPDERRGDHRKHGATDRWESPQARREVVDAGPVFAYSQPG